MGDKFIKIIKAIIGGAGTFVLLLPIFSFLWHFFEFNHPVEIMVMVSFFMIFVYYYLLTKNELSVNNANKDSSHYLYDRKNIRNTIGSSIKLMFYFGIFFVIITFIGVIIFIITPW